MKKKQGITLVEVIITLAVLSLAFSVIYLFFSSSNRTINDTDLKSKLQYESQVIQERLATLGTQSIGIKGLTLNGTDVQELKFQSPDVITKNPTETITETIEYIFKVDSNKSMILTENKITKTELASGSNSLTSSENNKVLSNYIDSFKIELIGTNDVDKAKAIKVTVKLKAKKGESNKELTTSTIVTFRNYGL